MLKIAKKSLKGWKVKKQDAFNLSIKEKFDVVYSFRFIRHLKLRDRMKVYVQIKKIMNDDGYFIMDAVNYNKSFYVRKRKGFKNYPIYDRLYKKKELVKELEKNGFKIVVLKGCLNHLYTSTAISKLSMLLKCPSVGFRLIKFVESFNSNNPLEWIVVCRKK